MTSAGLRVEDGAVQSTVIPDRERSPIMPATHLSAGDGCCEAALTLHLGQASLNTETTFTDIHHRPPRAAPGLGGNVCKLVIVEYIQGFLY